MKAQAASHVIGASLISRRQRRAPLAVAGAHRRPASGVGRGAHEGIRGRRCPDALSYPLVPAACSTKSGTSGKSSSTLSLRLTPRVTAQRASQLIDSPPVYASVDA